MCVGGILLSQLITKLVGNIYKTVSEKFPFSENVLRLTNKPQLRSFALFLRLNFLLFFEWLWMPTCVVESFFFLDTLNFFIIKGAFYRRPFYQLLSDLFFLVWFGIST